MGINLDVTDRAPQSDEHPDAVNEVPLTRASLVGGPVGGLETDEPITEPTEEELAELPDVSDEPVYDEKGTK